MRSPGPPPQNPVMLVAMVPTPSVVAVGLTDAAERMFLGDTVVQGAPQKSEALGSRVLADHYAIRGATAKPDDVGRLSSGLRLRRGRGCAHVQWLVQIDMVIVSLHNETRNTRLDNF